MRKAVKELVSLIDKKLQHNGLAQQAIKEKDARTLVWLAATAMVGIKEFSGKNDGYEVGLIQSVVGGPERWPWCASFVMACIMYAEVKTGKKSPVVATEHAQSIWWMTPKIQRVKAIPLAGAIIVWGYKDSKGKLTVKGHTEIVIGADIKVIRCIGGNTSGTTSPNQAVNREGNGAFYTVRDYKSTAKKQYLGCVKPF
jgi:hypothetical protein